MQLSRTSVLVAPVLILLLFATTLVGIDRLGFRDVSHFYTPLYDYVASRTSDQWLPLWNPLDQTGMPLLGETTTAVLYPVRYALFSLPISTETAISWYVALHLILASIGAVVAARWSGVGPLAATVAGIVYPLSGSILFLYTNPTFLVGAAWLPWVLGAMLARAPISTSMRILIAGTSMSMMILGGDPQTALHAMIVMGAVWLVRLIRRKHVENIPVRTLIAAPVLAAALAAPQLAASVSWTSQSDRMGEQKTQRWIDPPLVGGKQHEAYQFSLAPWHTLELATPHAFGSLLPKNQRISRLIPGDGRTWTPSIYMGMLVLVALLCRLSNKKIDVWMTTAVVSLWLAMGHFGIVWLVQTTTPWLSDTDSAIGGPYWWLYTLVPGYDSFRYPAKWLTLFSFSASIVTAQWMDQEIRHKTVVRVAWSLAALLLIGLAIVAIVRLNPALILDDVEHKLPRDEFWGPLDVNAAFSQINFSILHSTIALIAIVIVARLRISRDWSDRKVKLCLLAIVALDVGVSGYGMIARVPRGTERDLIATLSESSTESPSARWMRTQTGSGWPTVWKETSDAGRLMDVEASVRAAWFGRWHLENRAGVLNNMVSIQSQPMAQFWIATRQATAGMTLEERDEFWASIRRWLAIDGVVHCTTKEIEIPVDGRRARIVDRQQFLRGRNQELRFHPGWAAGESRRVNVAEFARRLRQIVASGGIAPPIAEPNNTAFVVSDSVDGEANISATSIDAEKAEFRVQLTAPGLLTRPVLQDGHWVAQYAPIDDTRWESVTVLRVDYLTQGVILPAGSWKLRFVYAPSWLPWSLGIAAIAWILVIVAYASSLRTPARWQAGSVPHEE